MTDLKKGIIEIDGYVVSSASQASDFDDISPETAKREVSKRGHTYVRFLTPIVANEVAMYVNVAFYTDSQIPEIELRPSIPPELKGRYEEVAKYKLSVAKRWLKGMIASEPHASNNSCVFYKFDDVDYFSSISNDVHYGLVGGEISITYHGV